MTHFINQLAIGTGGWVAIGIGGFLVLLLLFWFIPVLNKFRRLAENIDTSFAQIDVQLKRRFDLIPNILETVKGYAAHEQDTMTKIINARNAGINPAATTEQRVDASNMLTQALAGLKVVVERYPELKADTQFSALSAELSATENKIASYRQFFNDSVAIYNRAIIRIPDSLIASIFGYKKKSYLAAAEEEREAVKVKF